MVNKEPNLIRQVGNTNKDTEDATLNPQSQTRSDGRRQKAVHTLGQPDPTKAVLLI